VLVVWAKDATHNVPIATLDLDIQFCGRHRSDLTLDKLQAANPDLQQKVLSMLEVCNLSQDVGYIVIRMDPLIIV